MDNNTNDHDANAPDAAAQVDPNAMDKMEDHPTDGSFDEEDRGTSEQPSSSSTTVTTAATEDNKVMNDDDDFGDFGDNNDEFGDFDDFQSTEDFDDFQSMDDDGFGTMQENDADVNIPTTPPSPPKPTEAEEYVRVLDTAHHSTEITTHLDHFFKRIWSIDHDHDEQQELVQSPTSMEPPTKILCTPCSENLWDKLSRDSVFYNPITGSIGQFQWTRSETNKAYLTALGVTINYEEKQSPSSGSMGSPAMGSKRPQSNYLDNKQSSSPRSMERRSSPSHTRSTSLSGVHVPVSESRQHSDDESENTTKKPPVEEEPELDIDIAKAYCELTEETIRIFPDEKLKSMVTELTRLQRQATEYLTYLLDQREQLMMDAETYNDLISCIVGHAQRLREQHVGRDASPAMVSKKKKAGGSLSMLRRKQNSSGASMGGGVVGLKQGSTNATQKKNIPTSTAEGRRSM